MARTHGGHYEGFADYVADEVAPVLGKLALLLVVWAWAVVWYTVVGFCKAVAWAWGSS